MPRGPEGGPYGTETKLIDAILEIMRGHLRLFSSDVATDDLKPIATKLCRRIRAGESKMALDQFVGTELDKLFVAPNPYEQIVAEASALVKNSN
jgi:hypothetical protein